MGLMMLGAAMGDTITIHVAGDWTPRRRSSKLVDAGRGAVRRRVMPRAGHRLFQHDRQAAALAARQEGAARGRAVPRRGAADHRRGARQRPAARDHRFLGRGRRASARRRDHRRDRSGGRRVIETSPTSSPRCRARTIRRCCSAPIASRTPALAAHRPRRGAAVDRRPGAARSGQYRHHPADRRRGRRGRADPDRRQRRSLFGRGGARVDGRDLHAGGGDRALGRVRRLAARRRRASWSAPASRPSDDYLDADYRAALLPADRQ